MLGRYRAASVVQAPLPDLREFAQHIVVRTVDHLHIVLIIILY